MHWKILTKVNKKQITADEVQKLLFKNRGLYSKKEQDDFLKPKNPLTISFQEIGVDPRQITKFITRIQEAQIKKESVIVYGDYDTDGICATAILWECLYDLKLKVLPHIPDRFEEGYGINADSIKKLKANDPSLKLIITVDNGIVANNAVLYAKSLGIDVIISDHHLQEKILPKADAVIHTTKIGGAALAWFLVKAIYAKLKTKNSKEKTTESLVLAAIGTISDVLPLLAVNRSLVAYGLKAIHATNRIGLLKLIEIAGIEKEKIGTYEIGFVLAPRINAMGRLKAGIDALRLLCTNDPVKAQLLARKLNSTNIERINIVENVSIHALKSAGSNQKYSIVLAHESYHEGVIGLAASELVKKFYLPAIVISKGKLISKASARSIEGFDIMAAIRKLDSLIISGGGHTMAAGFTLETANINKFALAFNEIARKSLTADLLQRLLKIDTEIPLNLIDDKLLVVIGQFAPFGPGNYEPTFATRDVLIKNVHTVGNDAKHLKFSIEGSDTIYDAIAFGMGRLGARLTEEAKVGLAYNIYENVWNGKRKIELRVRDIDYKT